MENTGVCRDSGLCGGCVYQGVPYEEQLKNKEGEVRSLLEKKEVECRKNPPIEPAPSRYGYRNKMEYTFGDARKGRADDAGNAQEKAFHVNNNR